MAFERKKTDVVGTNEENNPAKRTEDTVVCYCGKNITPSMLKCSACQKLFHSTCLKNGRPSIFKGDVFFEFTCVKCSDTGKEKCERKSMNWLQVVYLALYNLICRGSGRKGYFRWKDDLCQFIDQNWMTFNADRKKTTSWCSTVAGTLSTNCPKIFKSGQKEFKEGGWWTLQEVLPPSEKPEVVTPGVNPRRRKKGAHARTGEAGKSNSAAAKKRRVDGVVENGVSAKVAESAQNHESTLEKLADCENTSAIQTVSEANIADQIHSFLESNGLEYATGFPSGDIFEYIGDLGAMDDNLEQDGADLLLSSFAAVNNDAEECEMAENEQSSAAVIKEEGVLVLDPEHFTNQPVETDNNTAVDESYDRKDGRSLRTMQAHEERSLLEKLNEIDSQNPTARRLRRKLLVNHHKRHCGLAVFDLDNVIKNSLNTVSHYVVSNGEVSPVLSPPSEDVAKTGMTMKQRRTSTPDRILDRFMMQPVSQKPVKQVSFLARLVGCNPHALNRAITSPYTSRVLKPFIRRDFQATPLKLKLLKEVYAWFQRKFPKQELPPVVFGSIDYCYVQPHHIPGVNALCREFFWPGIDLSECLQYPDFTCVVLYKKLIIGCAFMVPDVKCNEAYISFVVVHPDWRRAGIASFMIYHLIQTCLGKDVTLHVSANSPAMLLYQKFGFKPERFVVGFYDRYYPSDGQQSKHAFFLRLQR